LFTSVGRRVELLRLFLRAYEALGIPGNVVAVDVDPLAPALKVADRFYLVPRLDDADFLPVFVQLCQQEEIDVIFPLIDPDIPVLATNRATIESTGARIAVVSDEAVSITADKWLTHKFFKSLNVPTPTSWLPHEIDAHGAAYPLFIKPRFGSASKRTFKVHDARELAFFFEYVPDPIIQEYLPGPEVTNDVFCDLEGEVLAVVSRQRLETRWGEVTKGVTIYDSVITDHCITIAKSLPAVAVVTVQCIAQNGRYFFTEINARLGGGVPLSVAAGVDYPAQLLARAAGLQSGITQLGAYRTGLYLTRFDESFFISETELAAIRSHRL
jgi:carbamoyl-phosphate synthase large subunit